MKTILTCLIFLTFSAAPCFAADQSNNSNSEATPPAAPPTAQNEKTLAELQLEKVKDKIEKREKLNKKVEDKLKNQ